jgi:hypothetical protein
MLGVAKPNAAAAISANGPSVTSIVQRQGPTGIGARVLQERDEEQAEAEPLRTQPLPLWLRPIVATAILAPLAIAIFVDHFGVSDIILVFILVLAGPCAVLYGLRLTAAEHAGRPDPSVEGYFGLWIAHHLPLRLARAMVGHFRLSMVWRPGIHLVAARFIPGVSQDRRTAPYRRPLDRLGTAARSCRR